jgi:hypothetical protein
MRFALACCVAACTSTTPAPARPAAQPHELLEVTTIPTVSVRSPTRGIDIDTPPDRKLEDRGKLHVHYAHQFCDGDVEIDMPVTVCDGIIIRYQQGHVTLLGRDPLHMIGEGDITAGNGNCGTRAIDQTVTIGLATVRFRGYRTVRCIGGGPPEPLIF